MVKIRGHSCAWAVWVHDEWPTVFSNCDANKLDCRSARNSRNCFKSLSALPSAPKSLLPVPNPGLHQFNSFGILSVSGVCELWPAHNTAGMELLLVNLHWYCLLLCAFDTHDQPPAAIWQQPQAKHILSRYLSYASTLFSSLIHLFVFSVLQKCAFLFLCYPLSSQNFHFRGVPRMRSLHNHPDAASLNLLLVTICSFTASVLVAPSMMQSRLGATSQRRPSIADDERDMAICLLTLVTFIHLAIMFIYWNTRPSLLIQTTE